MPPPPDFQEWYLSGAAAPAEQPPAGPAWERYASALKAAENEAAFFSFWTLYDELPPLARHVGKLTFWEALRDLGVTDRQSARAIYDEVVQRALPPASVSGHPVYQAREDIRGLFAYMLGFRDYHYKVIAVAWRFGARDPYRGYLARFGIYQGDLADAAQPGAVVAGAGARRAGGGGAHAAVGRGGGDRAPPGRAARGGAGARAAAIDLVDYRISITTGPTAPADR